MDGLNVATDQAVARGELKKVRSVEANGPVGARKPEPCMGANPELAGGVMRKTCRSFSREIHPRCPMSQISSAQPREPAIGPQPDLFWMLSIQAEETCPLQRCPDWKNFE